MSITTYSELQTAIANWIVRSDLTSVIPDFISLTETRMSRELRVSWLEKRSELTPTSAFLDLPADYTGLRSIEWNASSYRYTLEQMSPTVLDRYEPDTATGSPVYYAIQAEQIELRPAPASDNATKVTLTYWHKPTALSASNTTNAYLANAPDMLLFGSLIEAALYIKDDPSGWAARYEQAKQAVLAEEEMHSFPGEIAMRYIA